MAILDEKTCGEEVNQRQTERCEFVDDEPNALMNTDVLAFGSISILMSARLQVQDLILFALFVATITLLAEC